ncbi:MAG: tRNA-specific 2-thiouridylase MnmA [Candidatus Parcubacteria bacterium]|jgi:tRNA-specific 2-thiouridylase
MEKKTKVFVGVSGGVDSSVALALLQKAGYDVTGVFLKVWAPDFLPCEWRDERRSAMRVCATLGVPFLTLDCEKEYKELVVDYMLSEYKAGRTPNPDVFCNKYVKFGVFLKKALSFGADLLATGHYAQVEKRESGYVLKEAIDADKDQSYFLSQLGQHELSHALFPIGHLEKSEVRKIAAELNLPTAEKKDSQGLCFIGKVDMKEFLKHYIETRRGDVLNIEGRKIGIHEGSELYTIGERKGFTVTEKTDHDAPLFVVSKDINQNTITVSPRGTLGPEVYPQPGIGEVKLEEMHWISGSEGGLSKVYGVRFRYRQEKVESTIIKKDEGYIIQPSKNQDDIASGQIAVVYDGDVCVGAGIVV